MRDAAGGCVDGDDGRRRSTRVAKPSVMRVGRDQRRHRGQEPRAEKGKRRARPDREVIELPNASEVWDSTSFFPGTRTRRED